MERYNQITNKNMREIVLLKAHPCAWGKCRFCDYILDNSKNKMEMLKLNHEVLSHVTGKFGVLEVINSGSCFELPRETLAEIRSIVQKKHIRRLFFEAHWMYRNMLQKMRDYMGVPITFKIGVETFNNDFREQYLNKNADFSSAEEVAQYFDSPCLMVGIKGQTREMIDYDIKMLKKYFQLGTINVYTNNSTDVKRDEQLVSWFRKKYSCLDEDPSVEVLYENTDFGVGD
ncbi:radical SAM protein [Caproicibacterium lactatifermentans]|uniref:Radical SAM protein n=1 Tax=Caproicibacterium lactatifermentans TaxID=2666138 RepID=A0ABX6PXE0_9FIRM|nr:radical SAM protein [Caproicibacterium lactatifermentans]QKO30992.1 radical SAM protein [Caproicibacterium lactatifermentans]